MDKFANPKLEKLFEALAELYPTSMGWQDRGDEEFEYIAFKIRVWDPDRDISTPQTVWFSADSVYVLGEYEGRCNENDTISFTFTDFKN